MLCTLNELSQNDIEFIKELPDKLEISIADSAPIYITHKPLIVNNNFKYAFFGHTHTPEYRIEHGIHYINPGSVGLGLSNNFCSEFAILNIEKNQSYVQFINLSYNTEPILRSIKDSKLSQTRIQWDYILKKTISDSVDYSALYINKVYEKAKEIGINNFDDIPMKIWDNTRKELIEKK